jgi:hypothetical protein
MSARQRVLFSCFQLPVRRPTCDAPSYRSGKLPPHQRAPFSTSLSLRLQYDVCIRTTSAVPRYSRSSLQWVCKSKEEEKEQPRHCPAGLLSRRTTCAHTTTLHVLHPSVNPSRSARHVGTCPNSWQQQADKQRPGAGTGTPPELCVARETPCHSPRFVPLCSSCGIPRISPPAPPKTSPACASSRPPDTTVNDLRGRPGERLLLDT